MKKVLALVVGMLLIPFTAFGMQVMTDSDMDNVTGQSGVAISVNDILIYNQGGDEIWYQNNEVWNVIDNEMKGTAAIGLVFNDDTYTLTYINGLFWKDAKHSDIGQTGLGYGINNADTSIGSRGRFGLFGNYGAVNWAGYSAGSATEWKMTVAGDMSIADANDMMLDDVLTPRPFMISVQNNLFGDIQAFYQFGADGISAVVIELGTVEIYSHGSESFDIYITDEPDPTAPVTAYDGSQSLGRIYRADGGITAYLSGDIAITARGLLYQEQY